MGKIDDLIGSYKNNEHKDYKSSYLFLQPAVEVSYGEVLLGGLYRSIGFEEIDEKAVITKNEELRESLDKGPSPLELDKTDWKMINAEVLKSPDTKGLNKNTDFLKLYPLVPSNAIYSAPARIKGNPFNVQTLIEKLFQFGSKDPIAIREKLFKALEVVKGDDPWAIYLENLYAAAFPGQDNFLKTNLSEFEPAKYWHNDVKIKKCTAPAIRALKDLEHLCSLKKQLTRKQWTSMVESVLRIGTAAHVMWVGYQNIVVLGLIEKAMSGKFDLDINQVIEKLYQERMLFFRYGQNVRKHIKNEASKHFHSRLGISLSLYTIEESMPSVKTSGVLSCGSSIFKFLEEVNSGHANIDFKEYKTNKAKLRSTKNPGNNVYEFLYYVLRRFEATDKALNYYDQGFYIQKRGQNRNSPQYVSMGPVSVLSHVFACAKENLGTINLSQLLAHIGSYGLKVELGDGSSADLEKTLRKMGLLIDSPDAEGGQVVLCPFELAE